MEQKVLDPACGSGTFLFHAIRHYLREAEDIGFPPDAAADREATALIAGLDIHPVAVIIARVTYLLALAPALQARKGAISIPVYLGDALQLSITDTMGMKELTVMVPPIPPAKVPPSSTFRSRSVARRSCSTRPSKRCAPARKANSPGAKWKPG